MSNRRMFISFEIENASFDDVGLFTETARILRNLANRLEDGIPAVTKIYDSNGNRIGQAEFYEGES